MAAPGVRSLIGVRDTRPEFIFWSPFFGRLTPVQFTRCREEQMIFPISHRRNKNYEETLSGCGRQRPDSRR
jgi:hypothetical protein